LRSSSSKRSLIRSGSTPSIPGRKESSRPSINRNAGISWHARPICSKKSESCPVLRTFPTDGSSSALSSLPPSRPHHHPSAHLEASSRSLPCGCGCLQACFVPLSRCGLCPARLVLSQISPLQASKRPPIQPTSNRLFCSSSPLQLRLSTLHDDDSRRRPSFDRVPASGPAILLVLQQSTPLLMF
jgi:hypothetical protein